MSICISHFSTRCTFLPKVLSRRQHHDDLVIRFVGIISAFAMVDPVPTFASFQCDRLCSSYSRFMDGTTTYVIVDGTTLNAIAQGHLTL
jgi:hypothetical protein